MDPKLTGKAVEDLFRLCLFTDEEMGDRPAGVAPEGCVVGEGIMMKAGFHPGRLEEAKPALRDLLNELPDDFHKTTGGGQSFLNMCVDKNGEQWGQHPNMDQLICLSLAAGMGSYCMPRDQWEVFPGGMPYVVFDTET